MSFSWLDPPTMEFFQGMALPTRVVAALLTSLGATLALGPQAIRLLSVFCREPNVSASPEIERLHRAKQATPSMGGLFLVAGLLAAALFWTDLHNPLVQASIFVVIGLTALGAIDDRAKIRGSAKLGLSPRAKLIAQILIALAAAVWIEGTTGVSQTRLLVVPLTSYTVPLGAGFIPLAVLVVVGTSNAVNLTDGLDGLAGGCLVFAGVALAVMGCVTGGSGGDAAVLAGAMLGGVLGFLRFNWYPARVFMGDTGSLPLGGLLGLLAIGLGQELLLPLIGGVFVAETASVVLQVGFYKWKKRRIFRCAPLHHHYQFLGWSERRVVTRFWLAAAFCALLGLAGFFVSPATDRPLLDVAAALSKDATGERRTQVRSASECVLSPGAIGLAGAASHGHGYRRVGSPHLTPGTGGE